MPDTVVEVTRNPLSDDIPCLLRLRKRLVVIHVRDVRQRFSFHCHPDEFMKLFAKMGTHS